MVVVGGAGGGIQDRGLCRPAAMLTPVPSAVPERRLRGTPGGTGGQPPLAPQEEQLAHDPAQGQLRSARAAGLPAQAQPPA